MPGEIFYWVFNMSIVASVTGGVILLLRWCKRIPRRIICLFWCVPFLRLWLPFGLTSKYSLMTLLSRFTTKTILVYQVSEETAFTMTNSVMAAENYFPITYKVQLLEPVFEVAGILWAVVTVSLLGALLILYASTKHELKQAVHLRENIFLTDKILSPAVYGVFRPRILLPFAYGEQDLTYILAHEKAHIRRGDNLWRILGFVTAILHWFNPFVWGFLKCFLCDLELACDEQALAKLGEENKKAYALALLQYAHGKTVFASAFGGAKIKTRVENILSFNKITWLSGLGFGAMLLVIAYVLLTNAG